MRPAARPVSDQESAIRCYAGIRTHTLRVASEGRALSSSVIKSHEEKKKKNTEIQFLNTMIELDNFPIFFLFAFFIFFFLYIYGHW